MITVSSRPTANAPWPEAPPSHVRLSPSASPPPMPRITDRELVERAREGDGEAFGMLVRRHQTRLHRLSIHMLRSHAEAEDATQEVFLRAYRALARFDGRSEPYTWLYRIAVNVALNRIRARKARRTEPIDGDARLDALAAPSTERLADSSAAQRQLYAALAEGIDGLSESLRTTLILVCIDGASHEDAAAILGAPEGTIAWRVHEARRKLKAFLAERGFDLDGVGT